MSLATARVRNLVEIPPAPPRTAGAAEFDHSRIERAVREILSAVGEDPEREGLKETPARVARALAEMLGGLREDAATHLGRVFAHDTSADDLVVVRGVEFASMCEHHLLPFTGTAHVAYLPDGGRVVGLSKIARTVDVFARRPQLQERLTAQIADAITLHLGARAVAVAVRAEHACMRIRGARKQQAEMLTTALRGLFQRPGSMRTEALEMLGVRPGSQRE